MKESQRYKPRCSSQIDLYQNCTKTLCNCTLGAYIEREAHSPKLLKTLKRRTKEGIFGRDERACKAGALPAELHAHSGTSIYSKAFLSSPEPRSLHGSPYKVMPQTKSLNARTSSTI